MKKTIIISILSVILSISLYAQQNDEDYYYYQGEKIFLQQSTDKIFLKLAKNANKERLLSAIQASKTVKLATDLKQGETLLDFTLLETKNGDDISISVFEQYKSDPNIVCALPVMQYKEAQQGLADEFVVKLKVYTSYKEFQKLIIDNHCTIIEENRFINF